MMALKGKNNVTGQNTGDVGDSMFYSGILESVGFVLTGICFSFSHYGRPWRHVSYVDKHDSDTFSRDQLLGYLHHCVARNDKEGLRRLLDYYRYTGDLCAGSSPDGRGKIRLSTWAIVGEVCKVLSLPVPWQYYLLSWCSGYQKHLISQKIWLYVRMKKCSLLMKITAYLLYRQQPRNLWFKALQAALWNRRADLILTEYELERYAARFRGETTGAYWVWGGKMESKHLENPCLWDIEFLRRFIKLYL
jgi:hypothetical protein